MYLFIWRHSNQFSSWSVLDELKIHKKNYFRAEVIVLASSEQEALELLAARSEWNIEELKKLRPERIGLQQARIITTCLDGLS